MGKKNSRFCTIVRLLNIERYSLRVSVSSKLDFLGAVHILLIISLSLNTKAYFVMIT